MLMDINQAAPGSRALRGMACVLAAACFWLAGAAESLAQTCRMEFNNNTGWDLEVVNSDGIPVGAVPGRQSVVLTFAGELAIDDVVDYTLRFRNAVSPPEFAEPYYFRTFRFTRRVPLRAPPDCYPYETYQDFRSDGFWRAEPTSAAQLEHHVEQLEGIHFSINAVAYSHYVIDLAHPPRRVQPGDCQGNGSRSGGGLVPTCQEELDIFRTVGELMAEGLDRRNERFERCEASGQTFYVSAPAATGNGTMGEVVICRPEAELSRDVFVQQTIRASFRNFALDRFNFEGATLSGSVFSGTRLAGANFARADLSGANLSGVDLQGANLSGANLTGANLTGANLDRAILNNANLSGANMDRTRLQGADLTGARLSRVQNIANIIVSETTVLCGTVGYNDEVVNYNCITPTQYGDADQSNRDYAGRNLAGMDFSNRNLQGVNFTGSTLTGVNFHGSDLSRANMENADLTGADLSRATLFGVRLAGATLTRASLFQAQFDMGLYQTMSNTTVICETVGFDGDVVSINCP